MARQYGSRRKVSLERAERVSSFASRSRLAMRLAPRLLPYMPYGSRREGDLLAYGTRTANMGVDIREPTLQLCRKIKVYRHD